MATLDASGQDLLARFSRLEPDRFADVPPARATDHEGRLAVTVDAVRRVVKVEVLAPSSLRLPEQVDDAVREAFAIADGERQNAVNSLSGRADEALERARERVFSPVVVRTRSREMVTRAASTERRLARASRPSPQGLLGARPASRTSDNGYLTVQRAEDATIVSVAADPEWLLGARPDNLEKAIVQAAQFEAGE